MENTANYGSNKIIAVKNTATYITGANSSSDKQVLIKLVHDFNPVDIDVQSLIFAQNYATHGYLQLTTLFKCSREQVIPKLRELYVYSFVKCVYNANNKDLLASQDDFGFCFRGHSELFYVLQQANYQIEKDDVFIHVNLDFGTKDERQIKFLATLEYFPFLKENGKWISSYGDQPFFIPDIERNFMVLQEDYYSVRAHGEPEKIDKNYFGENIPLTSATEGVVNSEGRIQIVKVRNNQCSEIIMWERLPIINAFLSQDGSKFYFMEVNGNFQVKNNRSLFFSYSSGIKLVSLTGSNVENYYRSTNTDRDLKFLATSQVFTMTGIRCQFLSNELPENDTFGKVPFKKVMDSLSKIDNLLDNLEEFSTQVTNVLEILNGESDIGGKIEGK